VHQLKDNNHTNKKVLKLVKKAGGEAHQQRIQLSETAQKKKTERRTEKRKNTDKDEREI